MEQTQTLRRGSLWVALCVIWLFGAVCDAQPTTYEANTDLPGMDYKVIEYDGWCVHSCGSVCKAEPKCQAWTCCLDFQKQTSRCHLKSGIPVAVRNTYCASGWIGTTKQGRSTGTSRFLLTDRAAGCDKLVDFVTTSPLPTTGVGWDYKVQLQATGGVPPVTFLTPYFDRDTGKQTALSCNSGGSTSGPAYYSGKTMVDGLTLTCDGRIIGQPKAPGYFTISIIATDNCVSPQKIEKQFVLEVKGPS